MNKEENMKRRKKNEKGWALPYVAWDDGGNCSKAGDSPEEGEKESVEQRDASIQMNPVSQTFLSEKQMAPDKEEKEFGLGVWKLWNQPFQVSSCSNSYGHYRLGFNDISSTNITHPQGKSPSTKTLEKVPERLVEHQNLPSTSSDFPVFHRRTTGGVHPIMGPPSKRKKSYRAAKNIEGGAPSVRSSGYDSDSSLSLGVDIKSTKETSDMLSDSNIFLSLEEPASTPSTSSLSDHSCAFEPSSEPHKRQRLAPTTGMAQYDMDWHVPGHMYKQRSYASKSTKETSDMLSDGNIFFHQLRRFFTSTDTQTIIPTVAGPSCPENSPVAFQGPPDSTGDILEDACCSLHEQPETEPGGNQDRPGEIMPQATASHPSTTDTQPAHSHLLRESGESRSLPHSQSMLSLSHIPYTRSETNPRAMRRHSLPDILLKDSFERFTPVHENKETYRFQCTSPGLYQCSVTGLVFNMQGEGDVLYRTVPWNQRLLAQHCKKPAGPLFDIKSLQQFVCQLHLPHCEIRSTGGCGFLSVAHVTDEGIEFIPPHKITETHVIINITGFSGFGNVKDDDSPPEPIRALVLLFYIPPVDADLPASLSVLLLPGNIVLNDVLHTRKKIHDDERYIEIPPQCKLYPKQEYMLCTFPEEDSILVQPKEAEFDSESYDNYFSTFQVEIQEKIPKNIKLLLRDNNSSQCVWERRVCLSSAAIRRPCQSQSTLPPNERLSYIRTSFIKGISGPVLKSLLDKLFEKRVITDSERESADEMQNKEDKARFVVDTVRKKGDAASSEMIAFLCKLDPFLCGHLGLI